MLVWIAEGANNAATAVSEGISNATSAVSAQLGQRAESAGCPLSQGALADGEVETPAGDRYGRERCGWCQCCTSREPLQAALREASAAPPPLVARSPSAAGGDGGGKEPEMASQWSSPTAGCSARGPLLSQDSPVSTRAPSLGDEDKIVGSLTPDTPRQWSHGRNAEISPASSTNGSPHRTLPDAACGALGPSGAEAVAASPSPSVAMATIEEDADVPGLAPRSSSRPVPLAERLARRASAHLIQGDSTSSAKCGLLQRRSLKLSFVALETVVMLNGRHLNVHGEFVAGKRPLVADVALSSAYRIERTTPTRWRVRCPPGSKHEAELAFELCASSIEEADMWVSHFEEACALKPL